MITGTVSRHAAFVFFGVRRTDHASIRDHSLCAFAIARCRFPPPGDLSASSSATSCKNSSRAPQATASPSIVQDGARSSASASTISGKRRSGSACKGRAGASACAIVGPHHPFRPEGSDDSLHHAPRVHHTSRRRDGRLAVRGAQRRTRRPGFLFLSGLLNHIGSNLSLRWVLRWR
jgi:hypothetical protein